MQSAEESLGFDCAKVAKVQDLTFNIEVFGRNWKIVAVGKTLQKHCEKSSVELMVSDACLVRMA